MANEPKVRELNVHMGTTPEEIRRRHAGTNCGCPYCVEACPDCAEAKRHSYSDATTPGFFYDRCLKHRAQKPVENEHQHQHRCPKCKRLWECVITDSDNCYKVFILCPVCETRK